jgi:hypothetical protein
VFDASAFQLLFTLLTAGGTAKNERRFCICSKRIVCFAGSCVVNAYDLMMMIGADSPPGRIGYGVDGCGKSRPLRLLTRCFAGIASSSPGSGRMPDVPSGRRHIPMSCL